jgi:hypothetical protein
VRVIYPAGKTALLRGQVDMLTDTIRVALVSGYVYDAAHATLADVGPLAAPGTIASITDVIEGRAVCEDITYPDLAGAGVINGLVVYRDPDVLLAFMDQRADTVPIAVTPNGGDVTFSFDYLIKI